MSKIIQQLFQDDIEAISAESSWALNLDGRGAPFKVDCAIHIGEGGCTTVYSQAGRVVGLSTRFRDDYNRTLLVCADLR